MDQRRPTTTCGSSLRGAAAAGLLALAACASAPSDGPPPSLGSLDGARVALDPGASELLFLAGSMDADSLAALDASAPNVRVVSPASPEEALRLAPEAHGADGRHCTPEFLAAA
ncbi:MAG: hypothetical protein AAFR54_22890, partial [Planctomycetota bacterium]